MDAVNIPLSPTDTRSGEILDRIKSVFSAKGFDGASMQDLAQAAGMSAGNFYRYFPSKNAIVEALAQRNLEKMEADFDVIRNSADPRAAFRELLYTRVERIACEDAPIWAEICAAAFRKPEIAALERRMQERVERRLVEAFAQITNRSFEDANQLFSPHACLVVLLVQAMSTVARPAADDAEVQKNRQVVALMLRMIEEVVERMPVAEKAA